MDEWLNRNGIKSIIGQNEKDFGNKSRWLNWINEEGMEN